MPPILIDFTQKIRSFFIIQLYIVTTQHVYYVPLYIYTCVDDWLIIFYSKSKLVWMYVHNSILVILAHTTTETSKIMKYLAQTHYSQLQWLKQQYGQFLCMLIHWSIYLVIVYQHITIMVPSSLTSYWILEGTKLVKKICLVMVLGIL